MASDWNSSIVAVDQGRHHHLRIERAVFGGELIALFEVQKAVLARDALSD